MFTGIIETLAPVTAAATATATLRIATGFPDLELGESVAVNGVCLTVTETLSSGEATFHVSTETMARTTLGRLGIGDRVNLERAVRAATRLSGHLVQGHVDGLATLRKCRPSGESFHLEVEVPASLLRYCIEKGSITLNGISLTINGIRAVPENRIELMIIPHTWTHTNLSSLKPGDELNVEVDLIAKYVERLCQPYPRP